MNTTAKSHIKKTGLKKVKGEEEVQFVKSSGNVFADIGLEDAEELLFKAEIALQIRRLIREKGLTQVQAAERVGLPQSNISNIVNGRVDGYSAERLLEVVNKLGRRVEVRIGGRDVDAKRARTVVVAAA